jgi:hypothetical protein
MVKLFYCFYSAPIANASKITVPLEYNYILKILRLTAAFIYISNRLEVGRKNLVSCNIYF